MIKQKKATDKALYQRYKDVPKGHAMYNFKLWYERGKKPLPKGTQAHRDAREVIVALKRTHTIKELAKAFGTYEPLIYRLISEHYNHVPKWKAEIIASYDGEAIPKIFEDDRYLQEQYNKAQKTLQKVYRQKGATYKSVGRDYGLSVDMVFKCIKDKYEYPHKTIIKALNDG